MKCKLTKQDMTTYNGHQWTVGEWAETSGNGDLCGPGWLHYYNHPLVAALLNPIHANFQEARCWEIEVDGTQKHDNGLKSGATRLRLIREIDLPKITTTQRASFGILCAMEVCDDPAWIKWANAWLSGEDRSKSAAEAAAWAAAAGAAKAAWAGAAAAWAAAAEAAEAAAEAAEAAEAAWAGAAEAARAEAWAAEAAWAGAEAWAAAWAAEAEAAAPIDLIAIAKKAMEY